MRPNEAELLTVDCESSGLHADSYPISIGVAGPDNQTWSWLVCPLEQWTYWDEYAEEAYHNIPRSQLIEQGRDPFLLCRELNAIFDTKVLVSDSPWDKVWLEKMFSDCNVKMGFTVLHLQDIFEHSVTNAIFDKLDAGPISHVAREDAQRLRSTVLELAP